MVVLEANLLVPGVVSVAARGIGDSSFSLMWVKGYGPQFSRILWCYL